MASPYSYPIPSFVITPSMINQPQLINTRNRLGGWLLIFNNSPYKIQVYLPGSANSLPIDPQTVDKLAVNTGDTQIYIQPTLFLPGAAPSSQIDIQIYPQDEPPGTFPMALSRQAAPTSGAAASGFVAVNNFSTSTANGINLNLFNPANSGVIATIYKAIIYYTPNTSVKSSSFFGFNAGADNNLANAVPIIPNNTLGVSKMHATADNTTNFVLSTSLWDNIQINGQTTQQAIVRLVEFPDQKQLPPGTNISLQFSNIPATGAYGSQAVYYTEQ